MDIVHYVYSTVGFQSATVFFLECVAVFIPLYYSVVAAHWINSSSMNLHDSFLYFGLSEAIDVLSSVTSSKKLNHEAVKNMLIDHGDSVSSVRSAELERIVETLSLETGDSALELSNRTATTMRS